MLMKYVLGILLLTAACGEASDGVTRPNCGDVGVPAMTVIALDALTRQPITALAVVVAHDGAYADTASAVGQPPLYGMAYNRPGTYSVTVNAPGYQPWRIDNVIVTRGDCNVMRVPLAAFLNAIPPERELHSPAS